MKIYGGILFDEKGISTTLRGMHMQQSLINTVNKNVLGFGKVGYQRSVPVVSSFSEIIGVYGYSEAKDTSIGRVRATGNPLDIALACEGYFQYKTPYGIKLTRDGRFKLDKEGNLLTLEGNKVMSISGQPMQLKNYPEDIKKIKVSYNGDITYLDQKEGKYINFGRLSVVSNDGSYIKDVDVRQGYTEDSNVRLNTEVMQLVPIRRNFEANRQLFIAQNDILSKTIQELGRP